MILVCGDDGKYVKVSVINAWLESDVRRAHGIVLEETDAFSLGALVMVERVVNNVSYKIVGTYRYIPRELF